MSALAIRDDKTRTITIKATLIFYGSEATDELATKIVDEIKTMYQEPNATVWSDGTAYNPIFDIDYQIVSQTEALMMAQSNLNFRYNFIRLEPQNQLTRSFMGFGLGDNCGHWITSDQLGNSTTAAHEFGHALGLDHPNQTDFRNQGNPGIMAPRGTIVDANLQWNINVLPGEFGGTLNPRHRRVIDSEIQQIVDKISFNEEGYALIGKVSNVIFDEMGQVLSIA